MVFGTLSAHWYLGALFPAILLAGARSRVRRLHLQYPSRWPKPDRHPANLEQREGFTSHKHAGILLF